MSDLLTYILGREAFRENRLPSLYSDFALHKNINPDGFATNVAAWEDALTDAARRGRISNTGEAVRRAPADSCQHGRKKRDHLVLRTDITLLKDLEIPEFGRPVALGSVFDEAIKKRSMVPLQLYKSSGASLSTSCWRVIDGGVLSPWSVMSWSLRQLKGLLISSDIPGPPTRFQELELVLMSNLKGAANRIVEQALIRNSSRIDLIYSRERFVADFGTILNDDTELSDTDFDVLFLYMSRDIKAIVYDGKTIKFRTAGDRSTQITQQDTTIASIKSLILTLSRQIMNIEQKIEHQTIVAKTALNNKNRISALSALRSRKLAEQNLKQRLDTLAQLEEVYSKIEQAADQVEIVRVMEASAGVLRGLHAQVGGLEKVENIVDELREEMSKVDEIGNVINATGPDIDEAAIDEELEAMEIRERQAKEEQEAELTQQRLKELDRAERATDMAASVKATEEPNAESELDASIGKLSDMSIVDGSEVEERPEKEGPVLLLADST